MSERGRTVLRAIDTALALRDRNPRMFQAALRADRTCLQLTRTLDRYRRREPAGREETYMGDREAERVDTEWEAAEAEQRRERFAKRKPKASADLRGQLRAMDMHGLYAWIRSELAEMSTVAAGNLEPSRGGGGSAAPPSQQRPEDDPRWERRQEIVKGGLMLLADLILEAKGHGASAVADVDNREAARRVISEGRGRSCKEAARKPELAQIPGMSPAFVRRVREAQGTGLADLDVTGERVSSIDGEAKMDAQAPGVRRVAIEPA